jgi:hypothetical protein
LLFYHGVSDRGSRRRTRSVTTNVWARRTAEPKS